MLFVRSWTVSIVFRCASTQTKPNQTEPNQTIWLAISSTNTLLTAYSPSIFYTLNASKCAPSLYLFSILCKHNQNKAKCLYAVKGGPDQTELAIEKARKEIKNQIEIQMSMKWKWCKGFHQSEFYLLFYGLSRFISPFIFFLFLSSPYLEYTWTIFGIKHTTASKRSKFIAMD